MIATWSILISEEEIVKLETSTGVKRVVSERVKKFWREFKVNTSSVDQVKSELQSIIDDDNK